jgi:putative thioredoxin
MEPEIIIDVNEMNFEEEVIDYSLNAVVILNFWASWSKPSLEYKKMLEKMTRQAAGQLRLAHVNIDTSPLLSSKFGIYTLPTIKIFYRGNIVGELIGYQPEYRIVRMLNSIQVPDPSQLQLEKAEAYLHEKAYENASELFLDILDEKPQHPQALFGLAVASLHSGKAIDAYYILKDFPASPLYNQAEILLPLAKAMSQYQEGKLPAENDLDFSFSASMRFAVSDKLYLAIDGLLEILKEDRTYRQGLAHKTILALLELLDESDPQLRAYRDELASILF